MNPARELNAPRVSVLETIPPSWFLFERGG